MKTVIKICPHILRRLEFALLNVPFVWIVLKICCKRFALIAVETFSHGLFDLLLTLKTIMICSHTLHVKILSISLSI